VDKLGPRRTLWPSLLIMAALVFSLSFDPSEPRVIGWIGALTEFVATPVWPAHIQFVRRWWPEKEHSQGFSILGAASRSGDIASKLLYMALLSKMSWQHAAWVGAAIAVGVSASVFVFHADSPHKRNERPDVQMTPAAVVDMLKRMACSASFWQAVLASSTLCIVKQTGERNLPLFFTGGMRMSIGASAGLA
jgi:sugar phosphate permease